MVAALHVSDWFHVESSGLERLLASLRSFAMNRNLSDRYELRMAPAVGKKIDEWRGRQPDLPDRPEAIRRLVELGLATAPSARSHALKPRTKAAEMAGDAIDRRADRSATSEEQDSRKRQLLKGPEEFRDLRRDATQKR